MSDAEATPADSPEQVEESPTPSEHEEPDCSSYPPPGECEPGLVDLACTAEGDKAKTAYNDTFAEALDTAAKEYQTTRTAYRNARREQRLIVEDLRNQIRHLVERIGCQIEQKRVRTCLDDAFCDVLEELTCCPSPVLCCPEDCEFPIDEVDPTDVAALSALITEYEARITAAKECFATLKEEPAALVKNVAAIQKAVDDINGQLGGDAAKLDLKKAYADALVAQWKAKLVWGGFRNVQEFVDCLCQALTCWTKGCEAVYHLHGMRAVAECIERRKQQRCDQLRDETAEQILAGYDRRCGKQPCDDSDVGDEGGECQNDEPDDEETDDDCGCHGHHHKKPRKHGHGHDHGCGRHHHDCDCDCDCGCGCGEPVDAK